MKNIKTTLAALLFLAVAMTVSAQSVDVKVNPDVKVDIDLSKMAAEIIRDIEIDFNDDDDNNGGSKYQQSTQEIDIPLSRPVERGRLKVDSQTGQIKITGYDGRSVKVKIIKYEKKVSQNQSGGMKLISSGGFNFEASEADNFIDFENEGRNIRSDLEIMVPRNFDIEAETYNNGFISIDGIEGDLDVESYNGGISVTNITGTVSASTYNGDVKITFNELTPDIPLTYSTYNGDIDLTVPNGVKFSTKMRTNRDIFTDFESFSLSDPEPTSQKSESGKGYSIKYENWVQGNLNGGGPEVIMKTRNGNIYIRKG